MKTRVVKKAAKPAAPAATVEAVLSPDTLKRLDGIAFKQVRIETRTDQLTKQIGAIELTVGRMAKLLDDQLSRILTPSHAEANAEVVFHRRAFKKISIKLRKRSVDLYAEDADGNKRIFRCPDWTSLTYLISTQKVREGIEEITPEAPVRRKRVQQKTGTLARVPDAPVKLGGRKRFTGEDREAAAEQALANRTRERAERAIRKLRDDSIKDKTLIDALVSNGFSFEVAYAAADNCGRITAAYCAKIAKATAKQAKAAHEAFDNSNGNRQ